MCIDAKYCLVHQMQMYFSPVKTEFSKEPITTRLSKNLHIYSLYYSCVALLMKELYLPPYLAFLILTSCVNSS